MADEHILQRLEVSESRMYPAEAGRILGRTARTVSQWIQKGLLTKRVDPQGRTQVLRREVEDLQNNLPMVGRPAVDLSKHSNKEGWLTLCECAKQHSNRASYGSWYGWAKSGVLKTKGKPRLTKRKWILMALRATDRITEEERNELDKLEAK